MSKVKVVIELDRDGLELKLMRGEDDDEGESAGEAIMGRKGAKRRARARRDGSWGASGDTLQPLVRYSGDAGDVLVDDPEER